jgi:ribosomal protein L17
MQKEDSDISSVSDQSSKQSYKFFTGLVEMLKSRIEDLESSIEINRKMIRDLVVAKFSEVNIETTETSASFSPKVLENLIGENIKLEKEVKKSFKDLYDIQGKALLSLQISNELESRLNEFGQESEDKLFKCQKLLQDKEKTIDDLKKVNKKLSDQLSTNIQSKNVIAVQPREDILEMHGKVEIVKESIQKCARACYISNNYREILSSFSKTAYVGCEKIQALLKNPINRKSLNDKLNIGQLEENPISESDSESESSSSDIEVSEINRNNTVSAKLSKVPKIDFSKISKKSTNKNVHTVDAYSANYGETSQKSKELKTLYFSLNDKITEYTEILEKISSKNHRLQQENVKHWREIGQLRENINIKMLMIHKVESKSKDQTLEKISEVHE